MTFYPPRIAWAGNWLITAIPGDSLYRSVTIPPVSTTKATIFTAYTGVTNNGAGLYGGGGGTYFSGTTSLSWAMGMDSVSIDGFRQAQCGMIGDAEDVAVGTPLASYLATGVHYDFRLASPTNMPNPIAAYVSAVLSVVILDGTASGTPVPTEAATGTSTNYGATLGSGTSTGSVDVWLDAFYADQVHVMNTWGAHASGLPAGHWWPAAEAYQPAVNGLLSVYHAVAVAANDPTSSSAVASPITYTLDASQEWMLMAYQSDLVPAAVLGGAQLVTILG